ncbi:ABC transporter permease [Krasilnikovia sp. MM14-A1259]|uniref:ABC transporter permease n=1 Tax=Krasilnikovia sp. MM14-A1259 TaxID=3373539 RepID=UPI00399D0076
MMSGSFAALLILLTAAAAVVAWLGGLGVGRATVTAAVRAVVQLGGVSLIIAAVLRSWWSTVAFIVMMFAVAAVTSARRIGSARYAWAAAIPIAAAVLPVGVAIAIARPVPWTPLGVLPVAGILIGGAMTATSLAGRRALDELQARAGEYEAALAIGLLTRDAVLLVCRPTAGRALVPALDQTRTVGLVTLPGAFVGVMLGGGSAVQAGAVQVLVLIGLLAVEAAAVVVTVELVAAQVLQPRTV